MTSWVKKTKVVLWGTTDKKLKCKNSECSRWGLDGVRCTVQNSLRISFPATASLDVHCPPHRGRLAAEAPGLSWLCTVNSNKQVLPVSQSPSETKMLSPPQDNPLKSYLCSTPRVSLQPSQAVSSATFTPACDALNARGFLNASLHCSVTTLGAKHQGGSNLWPNGWYFLVLKCTSLPDWSKFIQKNLENQKSLPPAGAGVVPRYAPPTNNCIPGLRQRWFIHIFSQKV